MANTTQWNDIRSKIKSKWDKFSDSELDSFKDNLDALPTQLQKKYSFDADRSNREFKEFQSSLNQSPEVQPMTSARPEDSELDSSATKSA
jgi:hypothetical protein